MEYSPFEFNEHTPAKFYSYCPTKDGFYLEGDPKYKYILDENQGWADSNGCYYDANSKPAGWISISICGKQYKHYDLDQQIIKEGENKCYSNYDRKSITNGSEEIKNSQNNDPQVLVKKQSNGSQKQNNQKEEEKNKQKEQAQPQKAQNRFKQESQSVRENNLPDDQVENQQEAEIPRQNDTKKRYDNSDRNGKRKREREAKQNNAQSDELPQYVEKQQSLEGKESSEQVVPDKAAQASTNNKKERRQNTKQQNEKKEQKEILYEIQLVRKDDSINKVEEYLEESYKLNPKFIKEIIENKILLTDELEAVKLFIQWQERKDDKIELLL